MKKLRRKIKKLLFMINRELVVRILYHHYQGVRLDLDNPRTFNEKLQWMKLYYHDELMVRCADKFLVREYIEEKGFGYLLNDLYGVYDRAEDIDFDALPESFVLKANHGGSMNVFIRDKREMDIGKVCKQLDRWLKEDYYWRNIDWVYKDIEPKILAERNLCDEYGNTPIDYKFFCFDGEPVIVKVDTDRYTDHVINYYDLDWNFRDHLSTKSDNNKLIEKPEKLEEMIEIARKLSADFIHARVDMYCVDNKITFGELTFFQGSGFDRMPLEFDLQLGNLFRLPIDK